MEEWSSLAILSTRLEASRPIRWIGAIIFTYRAVGTARRLSYISVIVTFLQTVHRLAMLALCFNFPWQTPWHFPYSVNKLRDGQCLEFILSQLSCEFCGNQAHPTSTVNDAFGTTL